MSDEIKTKLVPCSQCGAPVLPNLAECMFCGQKNPGRLANNPIGRKFVEMRQQQRKSERKAPSIELPDSLGQYSYLFKGAFAVSHSLIAVTAALYLLALLIDLGGVRWFPSFFGMISPSTESLVRLGATGQLPVSGGRVWSFLTAPYLSGGFIEAAINVLWLISIGRTIERFYGGAQTYLIFAVSGIAGGMIATLFGASVTTAGSPALFGMFAAMIVFGRNMHDNMGDQLVQRGIMLGVILLLFDLMAGIAVLFADIGGAAVGYALATLFIRNLALRYDPTTDRVARLIALITGVLIVVGLLVPLVLL